MKYTYYNYNWPTYFDPLSMIAYEAMTNNRNRFVAYGILFLYGLFCVFYLTLNRTLDNVESLFLQVSVVYFVAKLILFLSRFWSICCQLVSCRTTSCHLSLFTLSPNLFWYIYFIYLFFLFFYLFSYFPDFDRSVASWSSAGHGCIALQVCRNGRIECERGLQAGAKRLDLRMGLRHSTSHEVCQWNFCLFLRVQAEPTQKMILFRPRLHKNVCYNRDGERWNVERWTTKNGTTGTRHRLTAVDLLVDFCLDISCSIFDNNFWQHSPPRRFTQRRHRPESQHVDDEIPRRVYVTPKPKKWTDLRCAKCKVSNNQSPWCRSNVLT